MFKRVNDNKRCSTKPWNTNNLLGHSVSRTVGEVIVTREHTIVRTEYVRSKIEWIVKVTAETQWWSSIRCQQSSWCNDGCNSGPCGRQLKSTEKEDALLYWRCCVNRGKIDLCQMSLEITAADTNHTHIARLLWHGSRSVASILYQHWRH